MTESRSKKVAMVSLGCPKNLVDSEVMMGILSRQGYEPTADTEAAEVLVVNTCGFVNSAREESVDTVLEMAQLKQRGNLKRLVVAGCLVERYREELQREIPEIDVLVGVNQIKEIGAAVRPDGRRSLPVYSDGAAAPELFLYDETTPRLRATAPCTSYIKIAEGCDHTCRKKKLKANTPIIEATTAGREPNRVATKRMIVRNARVTVGVLTCVLKSLSTPVAANMTSTARTHPPAA